MYIFRIAIYRLLSRPGNSLLSILLFGIGISIVSLILLADKQLRNSMEGNLAGIDLVMGAKGSPTQLILSSVLHADYPTGNISLAEAESIARHPLVQKAIPVALGDSYQGFRIVGTTSDYPALYKASLQQGQWHEEVLEATLGYQVARITGLSTGDTFFGVHGFQEVGHAHDQHVYTITGVMAPMGNVLDNLILTPVKSVWKVHEEHHHDAGCDHDHEHGEDCNHEHNHHEDHSHHAHTSNAADKTHHHDHAPHATAAETHEDEAFLRLRTRIEAGEDVSRQEMEWFLARQHTPAAEIAGDTSREITAMLLVFRSAAGHLQLPRMINESTTMQAASPALELNRLFSLLAFGFDALRMIAWAIILVSGLNIFVLLWNTLRRGLSEIALIRVLGGGRMQVFLLLLLQGIFLAVAGWMLGLLMARAIWMLLPSFHFMPSIALVSLQMQELMLLAGALATGLLASLIPAIKAYRTDVHFTLTRPENA